jgi:hypothetical protein
LEDMVDPAFEYSPDLDLPQASIGQQRLARERYRVLWDISIDGRLIRSRRATTGTQEKRRQDFTAAFRFWPEAKQEEMFAAVWTNSHPTHPWFRWIVVEAGEVSSPDRPAPGGLCPLCGFPTFVWADSLKLTDHIVATVRQEFPNWIPDEGICGRCLGVYRCRTASLLIRV